MKSIAIKKLNTEIVREYSSGPVIPLGNFDSSMELFQITDTEYIIEWDVPELEETVHIDIWIEKVKNKKIVTDYDGIMTLPEEAIALLEENGFDCEDVKN